MQQKTTTILAFVAAGVVGYTVGYHHALKKWYKRVAEAKDREESDSEEDLGTLANEREPCKLVLAVRTDLKMTSGKMAAQCGHATLACYKALMRQNPGLLRHWEESGQAKIAVRCESEAQLLELEQTAKSLGLCARRVQDAGRTQIAAGSSTVVGIGPGPVSVVDRVTGKLRLL